MKKSKRKLKDLYDRLSSRSVSFSTNPDNNDQLVIEACIKIGFRSDARRGSNWADSVTGASNGLTTTSFLRRNSGSANQINDEEADGIRNSTSSRKPSLVSRLRWVFTTIQRLLSALTWKSS